MVQVVIVLSAILASTLAVGRPGRFDISGGFGGAEGGLGGHVVAGGFGSPGAESAFDRSYGDVTPKPSFHSVAVAAHPAVLHAAVNAARYATALGFGPDYSEVVAAIIAKIVAQLVGDSQSRAAAEEIGAEAAEAATVNTTIRMAAYEAARAAKDRGADSAVRITAATRAAYKTSGQKMSRSAAAIVGAEAADVVKAHAIAQALREAVAKFIREV